MICIESSCLGCRKVFVNSFYLKRREGREIARRGRGGISANSAEQTLKILFLAKRFWGIESDESSNDYRSLIEMRKTVSRRKKDSDRKIEDRKMGRCLVFRYLIFLSPIFLSQSCFLRPTAVPARLNEDFRLELRAQLAPWPLRFKSIFNSFSNLV